MIKNIILISIITLLTGCATQPSMYNWGSYEQDLFTYFHDPADKEKAINNHLDLVNKLNLADVKPAPGFYAEAGTFLLLEGETDKAIHFYKLEAEVWPESSQLMTALINSLEDK